MKFEYNKKKKKSDGWMDGWMEVGSISRKESMQPFAFWKTENPCH